jgi:hypothetical protein
MDKHKENHVRHTEKLKAKGKKKILKAARDKSLPN